jgi:predicted RecA/RadA family phage recombinase
MQNYIQEGEIVAVTAPYALSAEDGCLVGSLFGVAVNDALINTTVQIQTEGVFTLAKTSALAISPGDVMYWDDVAKELNKTSSGVPVAIAVETANNPSATVVCRLNGGYCPPIDATVLRYASVSLTNANIKNLRATPITLVAAPGANKLVELVSAQLVLNYGSNVLTESADNMAIKYNNGSGAAVSQAIEATNFIDATANTVTNALPKIDVIAAKTDAVNKALVLHNTGDGEYGGNAANDTTMTVHVCYRVHTV